MSFYLPTCKAVGCGLGLYTQVVSNVEVIVGITDEVFVLHPCVLVYCHRCDCYSLCFTAPPRVNNSIQHIVYGACLTEDQQNQVLEAAEEGKLFHRNQMFLVD